MDRDIVEELRRAAEQASDIQRKMAEAKSLRQEGNTEGRTDLYMWPESEKTLEGRAATEIESLRKRVEGLEAARDEARALLAASRFANRRANRQLIE